MDRYIFQQPPLFLLQLHAYRLVSWPRIARWPELEARGQTRCVPVHRPRSTKY